jgi:4-hydroxybutyrate CoA-transferase
MPTRLTPARALDRLIRPGDRVLLGTAAGAATTLQRELVEGADRRSALRLLGGMQLGDYEFMEPVRAGDWTYQTWHVMPPIRQDVAAGTADFHLIRGGAVVRSLRQMEPDVFLTAVSPPDQHGFVSLGASVSYAFDATGFVPTVIGEINPEMPVVHGTTRVPVDRFAALVDAEHPLPTYPRRKTETVDARIASHVRDLVPDEATVQIGIGSVPEALEAAWVEDTPPGLTLFGMGIDGMVDLLERLARRPSYVGGELLGTRYLYEFAHHNPLIEQYPSSHVLSVTRLAAIPRFVSITGAIEVDLSGQVNAEWASGRQLSGPGGGFDFADAASLSDGGFSVVALRATTRDGSGSTIVRELQPGAPVTIPRHTVQIVVTEHGVADLRGLALRERSEQLIAIAAPEFRGELAVAHPKESFAA